MPGVTNKSTRNRAPRLHLVQDSHSPSPATGQPFDCRGGLAKQMPVTLVLPHAGRWHVVVDLGGSDGRVNASVNFY